MEKKRILAAVVSFMLCFGMVVTTTPVQAANGNSRAEAVTLKTNGKQVEGKLTGDDDKYYLINVTKAGKLQLVARSTMKLSSVAISVFDASNNQILLKTGKYSEKKGYAGVSSSKYYKPGTYYLRISGTASPYTVKASFKAVKLSNKTLKNHSKETAVALKTNQSYTDLFPVDRINMTTSNYYKISKKAGSKMTITVVSEGSDNIGIKLYKKGTVGGPLKEETLIAKVSKKASISTTVEGGTYYIEVTAYGDSTGVYTIKVK